MKLSNRKNKFKKKLLVSSINSESKLLEQYRKIRTNLYFLTNNECRSFLITSSCEREGKSASATNLAVSIAFQKKKVLLVDVNFRNPDIHFIFNFENNIGLSSILVGAACLEEAINKTEIGRLDVLTSGPIPLNPTELLSSHPMKKLIQDILKIYDVVIFDSPSVLDFSDTMVLASQSDAVILVVNKRKTTVKKALESKKSLEVGKANLIGVIYTQT